MNSIITALAALLLATGIASAKDLAFYKATYEKKMEVILLSNGMQMTELSQKYTESLHSLLARVKAAGDLNKTTAVMQELTRFGTEKAMPQSPSELLDIQNLQTLFTRQAITHEANKARQIIALTAKYDQALARLQRSLVSSDKLDTAKTVQDERASLHEAEHVRSAKALLASYASPTRKQLTQEPAGQPETKELACTIHWSCADVADVYLNGEPLRNYGQSFIARPDEAGRRFSDEVDIKTGDVITVGARRGGSYGFLLVVVDGGGNVVWRTDTHNWKVYYPKDKKNWFQPPKAKLSRKRTPKRQREPWAPQSDIKAEFDADADSIWDREDARFAYLTSTINLK